MGTPSQPRSPPLARNGSLSAQAIIEAQDRKTYCHPDDEDILILSNEIRPDGSAVGIVDAGDFWHSDSSHLEEPCRATVLYAVKNPKTGGDTEFCNMYQVYDALPEDLQRARMAMRDRYAAATTLGFERPKSMAPSSALAGCSARPWTLS